MSGEEGLPAAFRLTVETIRDGLHEDKWMAVKRQAGRSLSLAAIRRFFWRTCDGSGLSAAKISI